MNSNSLFSKNSETHSVNILPSLLDCATQTMTGDTLMDILIPISFPLRKAELNQYILVHEPCSTCKTGKGGNEVQRSPVLGVLV